MPKRPLDMSTHTTIKIKTTRGLITYTMHVFYGGRMRDLIARYAAYTGIAKETFYFYDGFAFHDCESNRPVSSEYQLSYVSKHKNKNGCVLTIDDNSPFYINNTAPWHHKNELKYMISCATGIATAHFNVVKTEIGEDVGRVKLTPDAPDHIVITLIQSKVFIPSGDVFTPMPFQSMRDLISASGLAQPDDYWVLDAEGGHHVLATDVLGAGKHVLLPLNGGSSHTSRIHITTEDGYWNIAIGSNGYTPHQLYAFIEHVTGHSHTYIWDRESHQLTSDMKMTTIISGRFFIGRSSVSEIPISISCDGVFTRTTAHVRTKLKNVIPLPMLLVTDTNDCIGDCMPVMGKDVCVIATTNPTLHDPVWMVVVYPDDDVPTRAVPFKCGDGKDVYVEPYTSHVPRNEIEKLTLIEDAVEWNGGARIFETLGCMIDDAVHYGLKKNENVVHIAQAMGFDTEPDLAKTEFYGVVVIIRK